MLSAPRIVSHSTTRRGVTAALLVRPISTKSPNGKERLVILGSGWGGYNLARRVDKNRYDVTVVSPNSYFSFTPFLASTSVGTLEYRCATEPVRGIKGIEFSQGWADKVDFAKKVISVESSVPSFSDTFTAPQKSSDSTSEGSSSLNTKDRDVQQAISRDIYEVQYDKLVIAVGCYSANFGIKGVAKYAHFLKDIRDARSIRNRFLELLEQATLPHHSDQARRDLLSIRIVGGGPTGVEFAAELHDFIENDVYRMYPHLRDLISVTLYDVAPGILMSFDDFSKQESGIALKLTNRDLRAYAEKKFSRDRVKVMPNSKITEVGENWIELDGKERRPYGLLVWSTGLSANPFVDSLQGVSRHEKTHALKVGKQLQVLDENSSPVPGVFAIGDNATPDSGASLPATAQVANQMATYLGDVLNHAAKGKEIESEKGFEWHNRGSMVFLGNFRALVDRSSNNVSGPKSRLAGLSAWFIWRGFYFTQTLGWRNKVLVPVHWALAFFSGRDVTRF